MRNSGRQDSGDGEARKAVKIALSERKAKAYGVGRSDKTKGGGPARGTMPPDSLTFGRLGSRAPEFSPTVRFHTNDEEMIVVHLLRRALRTAPRGGRSTSSRTPAPGSWRSRR